jgi:tricorn protease-like protein
MSWKNENLSVGCSSGEIWVFYGSPDIYHKFLAHETQDCNDEKFGSLGLYCEIWSICWSPCGNFLASGSEDQSVRIWNTTTFEIVQILPKHKRAVTGVRWENIKKICVQGKEIQEIMVTCSDDESLRIYDPQDWVMLYSFTTSVIQEWHTITYAAIEKGGKHVACVTQNGFVFIIDLEKMEFKNIERIHNGSVEGLDWKVITCSSETVCAVIDIQ